MTDRSSVHVPVLLESVVRWLAPQPGAVIVDGTLGGGGHTRALAELVSPGGRVLALDRDPSALSRVEQSLKGPESDAPMSTASNVDETNASRSNRHVDPSIELVHACFSELPEVLIERGIETVDSVLLDLGMSSDQLVDSTRGFSFGSEGPFDLRFDPTRGEPAWRLLNRLSAEHLADLIFQYGEERHSRRIARAIVERRKKRRLGPIETSREVAELVRRAMPRSRRRPSIDPATRTFQAFRIAVNDELKTLETALRRTATCLKLGGRFAVISFHSLEDRRVKEAFRDDLRYEPLFRKPLTAEPDEIAQNPRARSAKLRVASRTSSAESHA